MCYNRTTVLALETLATLDCFIIIWSALALKTVQTLDCLLYYVCSLVRFHWTGSVCAKTVNCFFCFYVFCWAVIWWFDSLVASLVGHIGGHCVIRTYVYVRMYVRTYMYICMYVTRMLVLRISVCR